jgi:PmbA protein
VDLFRVYGNTHNFLGFYPASEHSLSCVLVAEEKGLMQREHEYTVARKSGGLEDFTYVAKRGAQKALHRLGARKIKTQRCKVIFEAPIAKGLLVSFVAAISGKNLYRRSSFLLDSLGQQIFPKHVRIYQEPHLLGALGSIPFDGEGVKTTDRHYVENGELVSYALGSYSGRKLNMQSTGNAGGVYNLAITHSDMNLANLFKEMGRGLFVTELLGSGVNLLTGDYSRGAAGYWIDHGEIQFPVEEITIAGNLKEMFSNLVAVGNDIDRRGTILSGSILIDGMMVAGD